jgi:ABC-type dipeptide/oligopeptide/nickel transport system permease subunit
MTRSLKGFRNAILLGIAWAVVWAPIAVLLGVFVIDPDNSMDEMWFVAGAYPGFLCAVIFSGLLGLAETGLDEVSLPRAGAWGAVTGVMVGALPFALGSPKASNPDWLGVAVMGSFALMSAASAIGSALLTRIAKREVRGAYAGR